MSLAVKKINLSSAEADLHARENAAESIVRINSELWSSGGNFSQHVTIINSSLRRLLLPSLKSRPFLSDEETRGHVVHYVVTEPTGDGKITRSVVITPDNKFSITGAAKSTLQSSGVNYRCEALVAADNGEDNEASIFIEQSSLRPLSEIPDPARVLGKLVLDVNDRMSRSLDWHINLNRDQSIEFRPGGIVYL